MRPLRPARPGSRAGTTTSVRGSAGRTDFIAAGTDRQPSSPVSIAADAAAADISSLRPLPRLGTVPLPPRLREELLQPQGAQGALSPSGGASGAARMWYKK